MQAVEAGMAGTNTLQVLVAPESTQITETLVPVLPLGLSWGLSPLGEGGHN